MESILVFRSAALGDFIMSAPALSKLREIFHNKRIVLLTIQTSEKKTQSLVSSYAGGSKNLPWVNLAIPHLAEEVVIIDSISNWKSISELRKRLSTYSFEAGILMLDPCAPWLGRLKKIILLRMVLGKVPLFGWRGKGSMKGNLSELKRQGLLRHHVHGPLQFLAELSPPRPYSDTELRFDLRPGSGAETWAHSWLKQRGLLGKRLLAIAPGALQPHKQWPLSSFRELLQRLLAQYPDVAVLVMGTPKDQTLGEELCAEDGARVFNAAGESSIPQSAALFKHVTLLVGNDGGAMHLGDAMGCKVVSIVPGIEYPDSIEPWHNKDLAVRWPVECAPCYSFTSCPQGHQRCMLELPVDLVWTQCLKVL